MSEVIYTLKNPFDYARGGEQQEAAFITLTAPAYKQICLVAPVKQAFSSAIADIAKNFSSESHDSSEGDTEVTSNQVIQVMYSSSGNMAETLVNAQELFRSGVAQVDGDTKLTIPMIEKMSVEDFEGLVGTYIANFIAPSLMGGQ